ncbi:MAG: bifunctional DNA-formamidopyrimidine glycosylase/DNA-(apurinic or apyrimidinic site) lyase [Nitrospiraceae bacterium]
MPELPEAEVVARQLRQRMLGATIKECWVGRRDIVRQGIETREWYRGARITGVERHGKSVAIACTRTDDTRYLVAELGMTGLLLFGPLAPRYQKHTHLVLTLDGGQASDLRYWNPRRFGRVYLLDRDGLERFTKRRFGCDPLTVGWEDFRNLIKERRGRLKPLLMHQQAIAGIGNIYANEILFRARLHPARLAGRVNEPALRRLYRVMRQVLAQAIRDGGSSVRDFFAPDGSEGRYKRRHLVYGKEGKRCPSGCGGIIRRLRGTDQRSSFYCPVCQRK